MATMNQAIFDRSPFNIGNTNTVIWVSAEGYEYIDSMVGFSMEIFLYPASNERVRADMHATVTIMGLSLQGTELIGYQTDLIGQIWLDLNCTEMLAIETDVSMMAYRQLAFHEEFDAEVFSGRSYSPPFEVECTETIGLEYIAYYEIWPEVVEGYELVSTVLSVESVQEFVCMLNVTLKPGQRLIIDADNYNITVDGVDMIECHSGEWLDALNRNTTGISIQAASGGRNLSASILYTERYL